MSRLLRLHRLQALQVCLPASFIFVTSVSQSIFKASERAFITSFIPAHTPPFFHSLDFRAHSSQLAQHGPPRASHYGVYSDVRAPHLIKGVGLRRVSRGSLGHELHHLPLVGSRHPLHRRHVQQPRARAPQVDCSLVARDLARWRARHLRDHPAVLPTKYHRTAARRDHARDRLPARRVQTGFLLVGSV